MNRVDVERYAKSSAGTHVDCDDSALEVKFYYSKIAWIFITFFGTTRMPYKIEFRCKKTGELFERVTDKSLIEHYMKYRRV